MRRSGLSFLPVSLIAFGATLLSLSFATTAYAQAIRTWVSGVGDDVNPCSRTAPCKTFAGAISKTMINGEINCLDPAGFGAVTITKSITIDCTGTFGSIAAAGTTGVIVNIAANANDPTRTVRLRGISIMGAGSSGTVGTRTGIDGIRILQANLVFIEDVVVGEFTQQGIEVAATANVTLRLDNVTVRDTNASCIRLATTSGQVVTMIHNTRVTGCPIGIESAGLGRVGILRSAIAQVTTGVQTSGSNNIVNAQDIMVTFATTGLLSNAGSTIRLSNSIITQNVTGLNANGGAIISLSLNSVTGNTSDGAFTGTVGKL